MGVRGGGSERGWGVERNEPQIVRYLGFFDYLESFQISDVRLIRFLGSKQEKVVT